MPITLKGDINNDGIVSGADVVYLASVIANIQGFNLNEVSDADLTILSGRISDNSGSIIINTADISLNRSLINDISNIISNGSVNSNSNILVQNKKTPKIINSGQIYDISSTTETIINDFSLNIVPFHENNNINININFNYLTSRSPNTLLKIQIMYNINNIVSSEELIGEYYLGTENSSFMNGHFSINIQCDPIYVLDDTIYVYIKAAIDNSSSQIGNTWTSDEIPQIRFDRIGNSIILQELR